MKFIMITFDNPQWCNNMLSLNSKHVQHVKIYLACNLRVNLEVIALFSSNLKNVNTTGNHIYFKIAGHVDLDKLNMFSVHT
jgi:hypothetical protein